ncbi:unnamed protein product [Staurois parvus]|uniref:Uncharacterized protein n=1 Tax=Staurois parvus TaxID=386267 RepID=A0ABN9E809_9NEOB|nr:unnamed protein product [Staurois parvus]
MAPAAWGTALCGQSCPDDRCPAVPPTSSTHLCPAVHPPVPPSSETHLCPAVPPTCVHQCHPPVSTSATHQCPSVQPSSAAS